MYSPLVRNMLETEKYPLLAGEDLARFTDTHEFVVLFFTQAMKPVPETDDVAVILPELVKAFAGRFEVAVVSFESQRELQLKFRFSKYPALVFLKDGEYLGAVTGVLDWSDYLAEIETILAAEPSEPPPFHIPGANGDARPQA